LDASGKDGQSAQEEILAAANLVSGLKSEDLGVGLTSKFEFPALNTSMRPGTKAQA